MKGLFKLLLWLFGLLVVLLIVAAIAVPLYFDPNDYKDEIASLAKKQTGRDLNIEGDLRVSVFPWLGVESGRVVLGNAPNFGDQPFFEAEEIEVRVKLLPLLRREVEMGTVVVDRMRANLMRNKEGVTNWDDLVKTRAREPDPDDVDAPAIAALALGGLDIRDSRISWQDAETGTEYVIDRLNLKTGKLVPGEPINLELSMAVDISEPETTGSVALSGTVAYDLERQYYRFTPLELEADLRGPQLPGGKAKVAMTADVEANLAAHKASVKNLSLKTMDTRVDGDFDITHLDRDVPAVNGALDIRGEDLPGVLRALGQGDRADRITRKESHKFELKAAVSADAEAGTAELSQFTGRILGVALQGDLRATGTQTDNPAISGKLNLAGDELADLLAVAGQPQLADTLKALRADMTLSGTRKSLKLEPIQAKATFAGEALPEGPVDVDLTATASADLDKETLAMPSLAVKGMGLDVQGSLNAAKIMSEPQFNGELKVAPFDLRRLMRQTGNEPPVTADPETLKKVAVNTRYSGTADSLSLSNMTLDLDQTKATGSFSVANFEQPAIKFNLNVDAINADRYLPPRAEDGKQTKAPATPETAAGAAAGLPVEMLQALDMQGNLAIGQLILNKAKFNNVRLTINAKAGRIGVEPVTADLYRGKYEGAVKIDATGDVPRLDIDTALAGVQIEPLLSDVTEKEARLTGTGIITARLQARGTEAEAIKRTLNGNAEFLLKNGTYKGINLGQILRQANAVLQGQSLAAVPGEAETDFTELTGTLVFKDGVVTNDDLSALSPAIRVAGKGQANLISDKVDYTIQASVAKTAEGQTGRGLEEVGGYTVPVRCKGTLAEPGCSPDFGGLARARVEREVEKRREKVEEKVKEKLEDQIGDRLKDMLPF